MNMGKIVWSYEEGEGEVFLSENFVTADRVVQLDALVDWISSLQRIYEEMLKQDQEVESDEQS